MKFIDQSNFYSNDLINAQYQVVTLAPLLASMVITLSMSAQNGELETAVSERPRATGLAITGLLLLTTAILLSVSGATWSLHGAAASMARNLSGYTGLIFGLLTFLPVNRALFVPIAWGGLALVSQRDDGSFPFWAWSMQPSHSLEAWVWAGSMALAGTFLYVIHHTKGLVTSDSK
jgi:hypothetical protein